MYSDITLDHFYNPRNARKMQDPTHVGIAGKIGDAFMVLFLKIDNGKIIDASFQTYGCAGVIAAGSMLTEMVKDKTRTEAKMISENQLDSMLGKLPQTKQHMVSLAIRALTYALEAA